jgi:colanic acid/amylovoran biosynthesis glycosyltransferase
LKKKYKIAIYSGSVPSTTFVERLILGLSKSGCQVYLFGILKNKTNYNSSIIALTYKNTKPYKAWYLLKYSVLLKFFRSKQKQELDSILRSKSKNIVLDKMKCYPVLWHKPDVFHVQWAKGLADWMWVKEFGVKLVLSLRGAHINYSPIANLELAAMYCQHFPQVDGFHAVSDAIAKEATSYGAPAHRIKVVYSGLPQFDSQVDAAIEADIQVLDSESGESKPLHIISVGRPHWKKGYTYALDACNILKRAGFSFKYTIIGGRDDIELLYQVHDLNLQDEVCLSEQQPFETVKRMMQNADILLLPSVEEGIANVVLEAMALGTLVLSTNCGGMAEVITDSQNGFLVPIRNSEAIAKAVMHITALSLERKLEILKSAQNTIVEQHTENQMTSGMIGLYQEVLNCK